MKNMLNDAKQYRQYLLRIDKNVFEEIKNQAEKDRRGISREMEFMLDWYLKNLKNQKGAGNHVKHSGINGKADI